MPFSTTSTENLAYEGGKSSPETNSTLWKGITFLSLILACVALILGIVVHANTRNPVLPEGVVAPFAGGGGSLKKSCKDVASTTSGLYTIQPDPNAFPVTVYCDQQTNGGGWTLVASIHENNIWGKCTAGDKWSSEQGDTTKDFRGSGNWDNFNIFGRIDSLTSQDYKNSAYHSLKATDVMIWHVPSDTRISEIQEKSFLKYYTDNGFLSKHGGTLQKMYREKVPMRQAVGGLDPLVALLNKSSANITSLIPQWYTYKYDSVSPATRIRDGGKDMYDGGNIVYYKTDKQNFTDMIVYGNNYFGFNNNMEVTSNPGWPFVTLIWLGESPSMTDAVNEIYIRVKSNFGADGQGEVAVHNTSTLHYRNMRAGYRAFNVFNASRDPSICEVFFYIGNPLWNTKYPTNFTAHNKWSDNTREADNVVVASGAPRNLLIGYTLLSRFSVEKNYGILVTKHQIESVIREYMIVAENFRYSFPNSNVNQPVKYATGSDAVVMQGIPGDEKRFVVPGHIQFRAYNSVGYPNALCPGVKTTSEHPDRFCVGTINTYPVNVTQCGDFSAWGGGKVASLQNTPTDVGRSLNDINSALLIFTK